MKQINSRKDISWFKIKNYDYISELNDIELLEELLMRIIFYENGVKEFASSTLDTLGWRRILDGKPSIKKSSEIALSDNSILPKKYTQIKKLSSNEAVFPVCTLEVESLYSELQKATTDQKNQADDADDTIVKFSYSEFMEEANVICNIGLEKYTDEEILIALKHHLPSWRKDLKTPEPVKRFIRPSEITKTRDYRIIPFLDLMIWEKQMGISIPKSVIAVCVFPDGEIGEVDLASFNGKVSNLLNIILKDDFSITKITGDFDY